MELPSPWRLLPLCALALIVHPAAPAQVWLDAKLLTQSAPLAYDSARGRVVTFGGMGALDDTREWDGTRWILRGPSVRPGARWGHGLAYDGLRGRTVLFGGYLGLSSTALSDTWEWNGVVWLQRTPALSPPARSKYGIAYDSARGRTVIFGGLDSTENALGDTWEWDGTSWTRAFPPSSPPPGPGQMAYDTQRRRTVLFYGTVVAQTWEWDGTSWSRPVLAQEPPTRWDHAMAYDSGRGRVVLFGGQGGTGHDDTWEYDGTSWVRANPAVHPPQKHYHGMAYDAARGRVVLFGRGFSGPPDTETWEWDGSSWSLRRAAENPTAWGNGHLLACDTVRRRVVLVSHGGGASLVTWEWDGRTWARRTPAQSPPARPFSALAHDPARGRTVLFGGGNWSGGHDDTWEWDGSSWTKRNPTFYPQRRYQHGMAHDLSRSRTVLFGGLAPGLPPTVFADTWEWDGNVWTQRFPTVSPTPRAMAPMAYDSVRRRIVLVGWSTAAAQYGNDTWEWDGNTWIQMQPAVKAPDTSNPPRLAYDPLRQRVVMREQSLSSTWEWDGINWTSVAGNTPGDAPLAYDPIRGAILAISTAGSTSHYGNLTSAASVPLGSACPGSSGPPILTSGLPRLGDAAAVVDLLSARANAPCGIGLATGTQSMSLGNGCSLYLGGAIVLVSGTSDASGFLSLAFTMPLDPVLQGAVLYSQAVVVDPGGALAGAAFTGGLGLTLGW